MTAISIIEKLGVNFRSRPPNPKVGDETVRVTMSWHVGKHGGTVDTVIVGIVPLSQPAPAYLRTEVAWHGLVDRLPRYSLQATSVSHEHCRWRE